MSDKDQKKGVTGDATTPPAGSPTDRPTPTVGSTPSNPPAPPTSTGPRAGHEAQPPAKPPPPAGGPPPKPEPKHPGMVTVTIDGHEVVAKPGTNMIEAAKTCGSDIPYYCYHPRLSIAANCRMCLVEVSNAPKLVPACQTPLVEGQVIKTESPKVKEQQRAVLEFILLNHPVDCAICDQAGECKLQDYYVRYDHKPSRLEGGKVLKSKRKDLGPLVVIDQERCILCTRCVRFMQEVPREPQLGVFGRGSHERIDVFPGTQLDSNYSGNTIDICPVGALLNKDFRFRARAWFLSASPSVCTGCSRGCSTFTDFMGQDTYRYRPRENEAINKSWMCDQGRLSYKYLNGNRVRTATLGKGDDRREVTAQEAVAFAASKLKALSGVAVIASPLSSNEDLMAGLLFAKESLGAKTVYASGRPSGKGDHFLMTEDKNPNRKGLEWICKGLGLELKPFEELGRGNVKAAYAIGSELPVAADAFAPIAAKLELLVVQAINESPLTAAANVVLPSAAHVEDEGTFTQMDGITQRFRRAYPPKGEALPGWRWVSELAKALGAETQYQSAREVWKAVSGRVADFASFDWDKQSPVARMGPGINPLPTGADGRPPGYREFGAPRVRGI